jgi:hypothetical protein
MIRNVNVELTSKAPMLMHADNIEWADAMEEWKNEPSNKAASKAGDDRTPPWRWIGCLNSDDPDKGEVTVPSEYIMRCIMDGAAQVPTGKGKGTFKALSQSGIISQDFHWKFRVGGKAIRMAEIQKMRGFRTFKEHMAAARDLGFELFVKRVAIGQSKHVRVRPRFEQWSTSGELVIIEDQINDKVLRDIFDISGRLRGLGDWRPGAPKRPGPFGIFQAKITPVSNGAGR